MTQLTSVLDNLDEVAAILVTPLQQIAVASLSVVGTMLIVFFLSIYMVIDRDQILAFLFRLVPPSYAEEARLLQTSVSRSFGGFLRGQALMGATYFVIALITSVVMGLPLVALTSVSAGLLMSIPFFGPFVSWAPPVIVALLFVPSALLPTLALMVAGWFVVMNVLQPRIMRESVGIHPIVVLGSVHHRVAAGRHPGRDLRHPDRRGRFRLLLPLPPAVVGRPVRRRPRRETGLRARGPARPGPARARARHRGGRGGRRPRPRRSR